MGGEPGAVAAFMTLWDSGLDQLAAFFTGPRVEKEVADKHFDLGQLDFLVRVVDLERGKIRAPAFASLRLDNDGLGRIEKPLPVSGMAFPGSRLSLLSSGGPLLERTVRGRRSVGVGGVLIESGLEGLSLLSNRLEILLHLIHSVSQRSVFGDDVKKHTDYPLPQAMLAHRARGAFGTEESRAFHDATLPKRTRSNPNSGGKKNCNDVKTPFSTCLDHMWKKGGHFGYPLNGYQHIQCWHR